jgi:catechol 2,3-dioxygenase-like lactoylglutathione lyase family enzyme
MFKAKAAFSGFSVKDLAEAREFYSGVLGLTVDEEEGRGVRLHLPGGGDGVRLSQA